MDNAKMEQNIQGYWDGKQTKYEMEGVQKRLWNDTEFRKEVESWLLHIPFVISLLSSHSQYISISLKAGKALGCYCTNILVVCPCT